ncbi:unnamed protein product [Caenorhabditis bovis]|uniref:Nuclear receptor domain-containing protein n=1 Tax=Caenorhabditis bovis TaxID=2654633 RepID=A0A8S1EUA8_9PELO|nr:unnamed protein product [Caenorhabditis bovis]
MESSPCASSDYESICEICSQTAHGSHFGVLACRACAAFFRRTAVLGRTYKCRRRRGKCALNFELNEKLICKYCRYQKCLERGMTPQSMFIQKIPFHELFHSWEKHMDRCAQWLSFSDEFRNLPAHEKMAFFKAIWAPWRRFESIVNNMLAMQLEFEKVHTLADVFKMYKCILTDPELFQN